MMAFKPSQNRLNYKGEDKMDEMSTCCEAADGAQCCRAGNGGGWCEKPPLVTASARNPRK